MEITRGYSHERGYCTVAFGRHEPNDFIETGKRFFDERTFWGDFFDIVQSAMVEHVHWREVPRSYGPFVQTLIDIPGAILVDDRFWLKAPTGTEVTLAWERQIEEMHRTATTA